MCPGRTAEGGGQGGGSRDTVERGRLLAAPGGRALASDGLGCCLASYAHPPGPSPVTRHPCACLLAGQEEVALAVRDARLADPAAFDEERTWYRRHTNAHTHDDWGSPEEERAALQEVAARQRLRLPPAEDVDIGGIFSSFLGDTGQEDGGDY